MKTLKRILSLLICLTLTIPLLPALPAFAKTYSGTCGDDLTWSLDTGTGILTISGTGDMTDYVSFDSSERPWEDYITKITTVIIGDGVTSIGGAFNGCDSLTDVTIPNSVTSIGYSAFSNCSKLTSIVIPDSVTSIENYAFFGCNKLTAITLGRNVISIGNNAFFNCDNLAEINLPEGLTNIGAYAFEGCRSLKNVTIPDNVTSIENFTFEGCSNLTNVTIGNGVMSIGSYAFYECDSLESVIIGKNVAIIGDNAFCECKNLTDVTMSFGVTFIEESAFYNCERLSKVYYYGNNSCWDSIDIREYNSDLINATIVYLNNEDSWQETYIQYINKMESTNVMTSTWSYEYSLIFVDNDEIPELYINGIGEAEGDRICTIGQDGYVEECRLNRLYGSYYIERSNMICNFNGNMDHYPLDFYELNNGKFTKIGGECGLNVVDLDTEVYSWNGVVVTKDEFYANWNALMNIDSLIAPYEVTYTAEEIIAIILTKNADPLSGLPDSIVLKCGGTSEFITLNQENVTLAIADESIAEIGGGLWTIPNEGVTEFSVNPKSQGTTILTATSQSGEVLTCKIEVSQTISVIINGNAVSFDQDSFMINGTSMVPLRGIFEMLGASVDWNEETKTATASIEDRTISITVGSYEMTSYAPGIGTQTSILNVPAQLVDGYTMVPVRAVSEAFGADVSWDGDNLTVYINVPVEVCTVDTVPLGTLDGYDINYADFNGMYIDSFTHSTNSDGSEHVTFDVYNTAYIYGVVEVYNANSEIKNIAIIQKMSDSTSIKGVLIDDTWEFIRDVTTGTALTYRQESGYSQKTSISVDIPAGGYIKITNDMMESFAACAINLTDIAFGLKKTLSSLSGFNDDTSIEYAGKLSLELVKSTVFSEIMKNPTKYSDELLKGVYKEFTINAETVGNFIGTVSSNLDNLADGKLTELAFTTAKSCAIGIAESTFENLSGPAGVALKAMFATSSIKNVLIEMKHGLDCMYQGSIKIINYKSIKIDTVF